MDIRTVGIVGSGLMGTAIARLCASVGLKTTLVKWTEKGPSRQDRERAMRGTLGREVECGRLTSQSAEAILANLRWTSSIGDLAECDLIVESIVEDHDEKRACFARLLTVAKPEAILASNTSTFPIRTLVRGSGRIDRLLGLHFINPVAAMRLVEIVKTDFASLETIRRATAFAWAVGKEPVIVNDTSGFILNRLMMTQLLEAIRMFCEFPRAGGIQEIDTVMKLGLNHPMGPFALMDLIGIDVVEHMNRSLKDGLPKHYSYFSVHPMLTELVRMGHLGRKEGIGFYDYSDRAHPRVNPSLERIVSDFAPGRDA